MSPACQQAVGEVGNGIGASLRGVDCLAADMTASAFGRLFGSGGALAPALTILLTLYIALFAYALITGRSRIGIASLTPRMVTLGLVLTFATSWVAYQSVVWNLAAGAPDQIASVLAGTEGSATQVFADKVDIVFAAVQQVTEGQGAQQQQSVSTFSPEGLMWMGATLLLLGTVGVLVTARIALAVLVAVGPVFVVMALFPATRGLFAGWLRGLAMVAAAPLFAVLGGTMMLELAVPVLSALSPVPGEIDPRAAMAFFMIGAVHIALMLMVLKVTATMVGNWSVFGLARESTSEPRTSHAAPAAHMAVAGAAGRQDNARAAAPAASRHIAISGVTAGVAANDAAAGTVTRRETQIIAAQTGGQPSAAPAPHSRARGIGSRFRAPPARQTETSK